MKKSLKFIALALGIILVFSSFAACSNEKKVHTGDKFTYWVTLDSRASQTLTSYNELMMYNEMTKVTGTEVEFLHPASGTTGTEAFQILLSSGDYPDMIEYYWGNYAGGANQAITDGVIIALNDYMEDYAPNYYDIMEGEKAKQNGYKYKKNAKTVEGNYYGFNTLNIGTYGAFAGLYVRKDMLDKWGLDIPETIDDWTNVFKTAKENGVKYPLTGHNFMFQINGEVDAFNTAWNVGKGFYLNNGKVKFGPFEKAYKDYITKMAEWTKLGYIDIDFVTNDGKNVHGYIANDTSIASWGYTSEFAKLLDAMKERNPEFNLVACPYPVMNKGDEGQFQPVGPAVSDLAITISVQCGADNEDRYKEAIKWCDYLYSDEGTVLKIFGIEGDTFTVETGEDGEQHYMYTDKIYDYEKIGAHSVEAALYHFFRPGGVGFIEHPDYLDGFYPYQQQKDGIKLWNKYVDNAASHVLPPLPFTGDEAGEKAQIQATAAANLDAAILNIILGKQSIDEYDAAISAAKKAGYDRLLEINQAAYDRYKSIN